MSRFIHFECDGCLTTREVHYTNDTVYDQRSIPWGWEILAHYLLCKDCFSHVVSGMFALIDELRPEVPAEVS